MSKAAMVTYDVAWRAYRQELGFRLNNSRYSLVVDLYGEFTLSRRLNVIINILENSD